MAHPYVWSQEGLLCHPAQSQEHGGDTRRSAITQGELEGINQAAGPVSATLCEEEQEEHCQSTTKSPPGYWCACFWPNCQKQTPWGGMRARHPLMGPELTARHRAARLAFTREHQNCPLRFTDESKFTLSTCEMRETAWRRRGERYANGYIIQHDPV